MKFIFKMFLLVGMIVAGKLYNESEAEANAVGKKENVTMGDVYTQRSESFSPFTQPVNNVEDSNNVEQKTEENFTYSLN